MAHAGLRKPPNCCLASDSPTHFYQHNVGTDIRSRPAQRRLVGLNALLAGADGAPDIVRAGRLDDLPDITICPKVRAYGNSRRRMASNLAALGGRLVNSAWSSRPSIPLK